MPGRIVWVVGRKTWDNWINDKVELATKSRKLKGS
jgi:hypothetical protein